MQNDYSSESTAFLTNTPSVEFTNTETSHREVDNALDSWLKSENIAHPEAYLLRIQKRFINYKHNIFILNNKAAKIQLAYRRYRFKKYQERLSNKRTLKICTSLQQLPLPKLNLHGGAVESTTNNPITKPPQLSVPVLDRTQSLPFYSLKGLDVTGNITPTLSERKKSVSFSDPLEEIYIVESFKTSRPKSADKYRRRRFRFERTFITPLQQLQQITQSITNSSQYSPNQQHKIQEQTRVPYVNGVSAIQQSHNINHIQSYFSGTDINHNNNSLNKDQQKLLIPQPYPQKRLSTRLFNFMNGDPSSLLISSELPTINEVPINPKNQINSTREAIQSSQSHLSKLQKRYVNGYGSPKSSQQQQKDQQSQNQTIKPQPLKSPMKQNLIVSPQTNNKQQSQISNQDQLNSIKSEIINTNANKLSSPIPKQKQYLQYNQIVSPIKKGMTNFEKQTFLKSYRDKQPNPSHNNTIISPKPFSLSIQKSPIKQVQPIAVYQSKPQNNTQNLKSSQKSSQVSNLKKSISPRPQKQDVQNKTPIKDTRTTILRKTHITDNNQNQQNLKNDSYLNHTSATTFDCIKKQNSHIIISKDNKNKQVQKTPSKQKIINTSSSFIELSKSKKDINTSTNQSHDKIDRSAIMDPNFFKRYLEVQDSLNQSNNSRNNLKTNNSFQQPDKTITTQKLITSSFVIDREKINQIQQKHIKGLELKKNNAVQNSNGRNNNNSSLMQNNSKMNGQTRTQNNLHMRSFENLMNSSFNNKINKSRNATSNLKNFTSTRPKRNKEPSIQMKSSKYDSQLKLSTSIQNLKLNTSTSQPFIQPQNQQNKSPNATPIKSYQQNTNKHYQHKVTRNSLSKSKYSLIKPIDMFSYKDNQNQTNKDQLNSMLQQDLSFNKQNINTILNEDLITPVSPSHFNIQKTNNSCCNFNKFYSPQQRKSKIQLQQSIDNSMRNSLIQVAAKNGKNTTTHVNRSFDINSSKSNNNKNCNSWSILRISNSFLI